MTKANNSKLIPVVMSGGAGTRLWPLSRQTRPKQFLALTSQYSLLQETINRLQSFEAAKPIIICNEEHRFLVAEQLRQLDQKAHILLEPEARNTAPAVALAALHAYAENENAILLVLPADHLIQDIEAFQHCVKQGYLLAEEGYLATFGIVPTMAETEYSYIEQGDKLAYTAFKVHRFLEKLDRETAEQYLKTGRYCWNSGMFIFTAKSYLQELKIFRPDIFEACEQAMKNQQIDLDFIRIDTEAFSKCPAESIDYAVMEKTNKAVVIPVDAGWTDISSWSALWDVSVKNEEGNSLIGDVVAEQTENTLVYADSRLVTTIGVSDLIIVETKDALLVAHKDKMQQMKSIVGKLQKQQRPETMLYNKVHRSWGIYDDVDQGDRHIVKRLSIKPGAKLSLQMHHHRAEHWVVVKGTAKVTNGDKTYFLIENESTYIPIGQIHSLENPGKIPLELIEVQSGNYLSEDDIVCLESNSGCQ